MSKIVYIQKKHVQAGLFIALTIIGVTLALSWYQASLAKAVSSQATSPRVFELVTGEFETIMEDGRKMEVYRWDPSTIIVGKGEEVELRITGVNGSSHPFVIEGLGVRGDVQQGKTTIVRFKADKQGTYPIVCLTHTDMRHGGPMVGYIYVQ